MSKKLKSDSINFGKVTSKTTGYYKDRSDIMPAFAHDTCNYVARYGLGNFLIQVIMKFDGRLDFDKLSRAVRLSIETEPVLGCRFIEQDPPYWKRIDNIDSTLLCSMEVTDNEEEAIGRFLESQLDMDLDPMVKVKLIRSGENDTLGIKLNHTCCDGAGTKEYIHLLSHIYTCIDNEDGVYVPIPRIRSRKDHERAFQILGIKHPELDNSLVEAPTASWPFLWKPGKRKSITSFVIRKLQNGQLEALSKYGKERGATINDLILTAFYRAMFKISQPLYGVPMDIGVTVDLRRYLPNKKAEAIRNFSGGIVVKLPRLLAEPFEETLARVKSIMNIKKSQNPGYQNATAAERIEKMNFHHFAGYVKFISQVSELQSQNCFYCCPGLSNLGMLSKSLIKFGKNTVTEGYVIPPVVRAPGLLLVASSYNGTLTLSVGYYKGSVYKWYLEKLLDRIKNELIKCCN